MKTGATKGRFFSKPKDYLSVAMISILAVGLTGSVLAAMSVTLSYRSSLIGQALAVADSLPLQNIRSLHGTSADKTSKSYIQLQEQLAHLQYDSHSVRYLYLTAVHNHHIVYLMSSEAFGAANYAAPGELYPHPSQAYKEAFRSNPVFIEGPFHDKHGWWLAARAPIVDPNTNQLLAYANIDVPFSTLVWQAFIYALIPLLLAAIPFAGLMRDRSIASKERTLTKLKTQLVSIASHDLRSPLNGMLWALQTLLKPGTQPNLTLEQIDILMSMYYSAESSLATVNEILDFSIFDRDEKPNMQHEPVDLEAAIRDVMRTLNLSARSRTIRIHLTGKWPAKVMVNGDISALKRCITNLLNNSIKYSREGGEVTLAYELKKDAHVISISDHGIGIPEDAQAKVLNGYYRADNAAKYQNGTGLGLWITRLLIEQHGGSIHLSSKIDEGTTVYIQLPTLDEKSLLSPDTPKTAPIDHSNEASPTPDRQ